MFNKAILILFITLFVHLCVAQENKTSCKVTSRDLDDMDGYNEFVTTRKLVLETTIIEEGFFFDEVINLKYTVIGYFYTELDSDFPRQCSFYISCNNPDYKYIENDQTNVKNQMRIKTKNGAIAELPIYSYDYNNGLGTMSLLINLKDYGVENESEENWKKVRFSDATKIRIYISKEKYFDFDIPPLDQDFFREFIECTYWRNNEHLMGTR